MIPVLDAFGVPKGSRSIFATSDLSSLDKLKTVFAKYSPSAVNNSQNDADQASEPTAGESNQPYPEEDINLTMLARLCERMEHVEEGVALDQHQEHDARDLLNSATGTEPSAAISSSAIVGMGVFFEAARKCANSEEERDEKLQKMLQAGILSKLTPRCRCA
jgi:hypothetical protein